MAGRNGGRYQLLCGAVSKISVQGKALTGPNAVISLDDFERGMRRLICGPTPNLRENEFLRVSELLAMVDKPEWSLRPRTSTILRILGCVDALDGFIAANLSNIGLPYTAENLPHAVKGTRARQDFLLLQQQVLSPQAADLESDGGPHKHFSRSADGYYRFISRLGSGGFGEVDHVVSRLGLTALARKRIPRGRTFRKDRDAIQGFENELRNLKRLSHRHLVKLIGSYTDPEWVDLLMRPVADMNLATYLGSYPRIEERKRCLRKFFGCLATAVAYLHQQKIRHKDIKPQNVLVHMGDVLLADFGTSRSWSDDAETTEGTARAVTWRYCAPEVANSLQRNSASDIWSLGCIYLEMATVLANQTVQNMNKFFTMTGTQQQSVLLNELAAHPRQISPSTTFLASSRSMPTLAPLPILITHPCALLWSLTDLIY